MLVRSELPFLLTWFLLSLIHSWWSTNTTRRLTSGLNSSEQKPFRCKYCLCFFFFKILKYISDSGLDSTGLSTEFCFDAGNQNYFGANFCVVFSFDFESVLALLLRSLTLCVQWLRQLSHDDWQSRVGAEGAAKFKEIMTDRPTDRPRDRQGHKEVSLPIGTKNLIAFRTTLTRCGTKSWLWITGDNRS